MLHFNPLYLTPSWGAIRYAYNALVIMHMKVLRLIKWRPQSVAYLVEAFGLYASFVRRNQPQKITLEENNGWLCETAWCRTVSPKSQIPPIKNLVNLTDHTKKYLQEFDQF